MIAQELEVSLHMAFVEARQQRLLAQQRSKNAVAPRIDAEAQPEPAPPQVSGRDLASSALAMARFEGEIARDLDEYNKRPRKKNIGTRSHIEI